MGSEFMVKLQHAGLSSCLFLIVSLPQMYINTNDYLLDQGSCPTYKSKLLHFLAFTVLIFLSIKYLAKSEQPMHEILEYSMRVSLLYFFISSAEMYQLSNMLTNMIPNGSITTSENGCPTLYGTLIHTVLFGIALVLFDYAK